MPISLAYQSTSIFSGNYKKAFFAFERRWNKKSTVEFPSAQQNLTYIQPSIPPEADSPGNNQQSGGGVSDTIRNLLERFTRPMHSHDSAGDGTVAECPPPHSERCLPGNSNPPPLNAFAATDIYIKHCDLRKNGASMQSLSQLDATRRSSPCSYYQFAKGIT